MSTPSDHEALIADLRQQPWLDDQHAVRIIAHRVQHALATASQATRDQVLPAPASGAWREVASDGSTLDAVIADEAVEGILKPHDPRIIDALLNARSDAADDNGGTTRLADDPRLLAVPGSRIAAGLGVSARQVRQTQHHLAESAPVPGSFLDNSAHFQSWLCEVLASDRLDELVDQRQSLAWVRVQDLSHQLKARFGDEFDMVMRGARIVLDRTHQLRVAESRTGCGSPGLRSVKSVAGCAGLDPATATAALMVIRGLPSTPTELAANREAAAGTCFGDVVRVTRSLSSSGWGVRLVGRNGLLDTCVETGLIDALEMPGTEPSDPGALDHSALWDAHLGACGGSLFSGAISDDHYNLVVDQMVAAVEDGRAPEDGEARLARRLRSSIQRYQSWRDTRERIAATLCQKQQVFLRTNQSIDLVRCPAKSVADAAKTNERSTQRIIHSMMLEVDWLDGMQRIPAKDLVHARANPGIDTLIRSMLEENDALSNSDVARQLAARWNTQGSLRTLRLRVGEVRRELSREALRSTHAG